MNEVGFKSFLLDLLNPIFIQLEGGFVQSKILYMLDEKRAVIDNPTHIDPVSKEKYAKPVNGLWWYILTYSSANEKWIGFEMSNQTIIDRLVSL